MIIEEKFLHLLALRLKGILRINVDQLFLGINGILLEDGITKKLKTVNEAKSAKRNYCWQGMIGVVLSKAR